MNFVFPGNTQNMTLVSLFSLYFLILLLLPVLTAAQTNSNITLGSSLTASNDNSGSSWVSPSGEFAFGFWQIGDQGFLLAIWFDKIPEKTIVWSANRDELVQRGSKVELTVDGTLVLRDATGRQIWNTAPGGEAAYGAMLDTGNFVLASRDSVNLWGSFDIPTDTILPTQTMNQGSKLIGRISSSNYSSGRFMFTLQTDGNLLLYTTKYPTEEVNNPYWSTQSSIGSGFQVIFNQSTGYMYLIARNGSILNSVFSNKASNSTEDFYQRAIVDYDGVFRQYVYPKRNSSAGKWSMGWSTLSFIPSNICLRIEGDTGSGACGFNSYCSLEDDRKMCQCPHGYTLIDPEDVMKGCKQNFVPQSCDTTSEEMNLFEFREMINTDWPLSDYEYYTAQSEDWCRQVCLSDCFCAAAIFRSGNCWKKKVPLSNGRRDPGVGGKALIKIRKDNSTGSASSGSNKDQNSTMVHILSALLGSSIFMNFLLLIGTFIFFYRWNNRTKLQKVTAMPDMNLQSFTYKELEHITEGFKEELGSGAFGTVYKGVLAFDNNEFVAVKKLDKAASEGEQEFRSEVNSIGRTNHKNLVKLLGFCNEGQHRLLVYEYMSKGSLANILFGESRPNWHNRMQIAFGTARGLFYLHEECNKQIIHCDIKPQNILLDDCLTARISDFGLAKLLKTDQTQTTTAIRGTKGYVAPEWFKSLPITVKVDVYSFGILLLELVCCRKNFEVDAEEDQMILSDYAYDCFREGNLNLLVEKDEEAMNDMKRVKKFVMIAIWCIQEDPSLRPTMKKVTQMMEGAVEVSAPPDPISFISSI